MLGGWAGGDGGDSETESKQAQLQAEVEGERTSGGKKGLRGLEEEESGCRRRGRRSGGEKGEGRRREEGEEGEEGEKRPLRLFIMMLVAVSVSCVGSSLYFMF